VTSQIPIRLSVCASVAFLLVFNATVGAVSFDMPMCPVYGGGEPNGPAYDFWMGRYEVTVAQYFEFLNDAEANPDNERGAYMVFDPNNGDVGLPDGNRPDDIFDISDCNTGWVLTPRYAVGYDANLPVGSRYVYDPNDADEPIVGVSWIGAVKFCNWLTIDHGLGINQRCYTEGNRFWDWHPVVISTSAWMTRDLNSSERQALVGNYVGYRLPMDNLGLQSGYIDGLPNPVNEWYKAAAYDPNAPPTWRIGAHGEDIPPYHWMYGYGSDVLDLTKANFLIYTDPNDSNYTGMDPNCVLHPTPVGTYAAGNNNPWGIDDLSGNVYEWGQDYCDSFSKVRHATHSKAYNGAEPAAALRHYRVIDDASYFSGFRVVQCGGYVFTLSLVNESYGHVDVEPNRPVHPPGALVTLTPVPHEHRTFREWTVFAPNHPDDANYAAIDANNPLVVVLNDDLHVQGAFKCGSGLGPMLPLALGLIGAMGPARREKKHTPRPRTILRRGV